MKYRSIGGVGGAKPGEYISHSGKSYKKLAITKID